ncbi:MAG: tyrosine--tRNA ligase [Verrucomicrobia bacterium]|nr:tyrosine--tRNA ligase [Verrucomicrobiota bacterium]MBS0637922.1 tyrosine--tRNA ligase [Verrucomicrobiota bacterium]
MSENVIDVLQARGLVDAITHEQELKTALNSPTKVYCGFDPTSDSLHVGNMVAIMGLAWFQRFGHQPVAIVGGATGMIGDPSGKQHERSLLDEETLRKNERGIQKNLETILKADPTLPAPIFLNNYDWFKNFSFLTFLRDVGKHFRVGVMMAKDSVKGRMDSEEGMSFTEFSYQLLQGYDFYHLFSQHGVQVQIGGSDQWGNITAGTDYTRKLTGKSVFGMTMPLLTKSDGQKFGKSEQGAIWLSSEKLSPYEFYQYLVRTADADVIKLLKMLTFVDLGTIRELEHQMQSPGYVPNTAQRLLAEAITNLVHGSDGLHKALQASLSVMPGKVVELSGESIREIINDVPNAKLEKADVHEIKLLDIIVKAGFSASKGDVRRLIRNGGVWLNNERVEDENFTVTDALFIDQKYLLISLGKKHKSVIEVIT